MANKEYSIPNEEAQMANESVAAYGITIPVTIPTVGSYTVESLTRALTDFAIHIVSQKESRKTKHYSNRLQRLHKMSRNTITAEDMLEDERLAYILNK